MSRETFRIGICPYCRGAHTYQLEVERAVLMRMPGTRKKHEKPSKVEVTQLFFCPLKNEEYEVQFHLQDTSADRIRAVSVIGLVEEQK